MVLKQGVKLPTSESLSLKSTLVGDKGRLFKHLFMHTICNVTCHFHTE